ncbi:MAG: hypothetical protein JWN04_662, partial [Myxococcaceae bacterium]|nr:hypothetical protein [Myxococcaceae bacterium]
MSFKNHKKPVQTGESKKSATRKNPSKS